VSPILVRPVREQLEHDRLIRLLQNRSRRRFEADANPGGQQTAGVRAGTATFYPDLLLFSQDRGRRLQAIIEVETGESVNHLEALAQWVPFGKLKVDFHLYVPAHMVDVARRLAEDNKVTLSEIWSYHLVGDQFRFTLMHRVEEPPPAPRPARRKPAPVAARRKAAPPAKRPASRPATRPASRGAKGKAAAKSLRKVRSQKRR
jgi:hypothetical protein